MAKPFADACRILHSPSIPKIGDVENCLESSLHSIRTTPWMACLPFSVRLKRFAVIKSSSSSLFAATKAPFSLLKTSLMTFFFCSFPNLASLAFAFAFAFGFAAALLGWSFFRPRVIVGFVFHIFTWLAWETIFADSGEIAIWTMPSVSIGSLPDEAGKQNIFGHSRAYAFCSQTNS